jgi:DNA polymerase III subunit epsilon
MRQIFLDTETTGLSPDQGDRILELGCVEMLNRRLSGRNLHHYINPQRASHPDALKVHGLTEAFLADKPVFATIADEFLAFIEGAELIIHNAAFDVGFLNAELKRLGHKPVADCAARITDSLTMARNQFPGKANSLDALCKRLEVDNSNRDLHGALLDAGLLAEVYIRMTRGQNSLVIDASEDTQAAKQVAHVDLNSIQLVELALTEEERAAHDALIADINKSSGGKAVWKAA